MYGRNHMKYAIYYLFTIEKACGGHVRKKIEKSFLGHQQNGNCKIQMGDALHTPKGKDE